MTARERGFLLLSSHLGNPERNVLTPARLRELAKCVSADCRSLEDRELRAEDIMKLGWTKEAAKQVISLLEEEELLEYYVRKGARMDCVPLIRGSAQYPRIVRNRLGLDGPACLWSRGDLEILRMPGIALVGSRELESANQQFAEEVGRQAAMQGYALISGNARGADRTAQEACLKAGGRVISVVADQLSEKTPRDGVLYLSEEDYDAPFTALRALSRNRVIHCLGEAVFVAQSRLEHGGTWDGTVKNLRNNWCPVYGFQDGSTAMEQLYQMGANPVDITDIGHISQLTGGQLCLFEETL